MFKFLPLFFIVSTAAWAADGTYYLQPGQYASVTSGLTPPPPGGAIDKKDIQDLKSIQAARTEGHCNRALREMDQKLTSFFGDLIPASAVSIVHPIVAKAGADALTMAFVLKKAYSRVRPIDRALPDFKLCPGMLKGVKPLPPDSYPSGHASQGMIQGLVLAKIFPAKAGNFIQRGRDIGGSRLILGVHHPSDVAAGQTIAQRTFDAISANPAFQAELAQVIQQVEALDKKVKKQEEKLLKKAAAKH